MIPETSALKIGLIAGLSWFAALLALPQALENAPHFTPLGSWVIAILCTVVGFLVVTLLRDFKAGQRKLDERLRALEIQLTEHCARSAERDKIAAQIVEQSVFPPAAQKKTVRWSNEEVA